MEQKQRFEDYILEMSKKDRRWIWFYPIPQEDRYGYAHTSLDPKSIRIM